MKRLGNEYINRSISTGSMRCEDLLYNVKYLLPAKMQQKAEYILSVGDIAECLEYLHEVVWGYLDEIAPEGCYFGSHPGDGADFGFWDWE